MPASPAAAHDLPQQGNAGLLRDPGFGTFFRSLLTNRRIASVAALGATVRAEGPTSAHGRQPRCVKRSRVPSALGELDYAHHISPPPKTKRRHQISHIAPVVGNRFAQMLAHRNLLLFKNRNRMSVQVARC